MAETQQETLHFLDYWRVIRSRKEIVIAVSLLVIITGIIFTYAMPRVFQASTIIQVKADAPAFPLFQEEYSRFDPLFLRTQFEIIQSSPVIEEVVRELKLHELLGRAYDYYEAYGPLAFDRTVELISKSMKVQQYRDTNLIEVQIYLEELGDDPEGAPALAARIADAIAEAFRNQSLGRNQTNQARALEALFDASEEQNKRVDDAEKAVAEIREKHKINIASASRLSRAADTSLDKIRIQFLERARVEARVPYLKKKTRLEAINRLSEDTLRDSAVYLSQDPTLPALVAEKRSAEVKRNRLQKALGPEHPDVKDIEAVISEVDVKIKDALRGMKIGIQTDYDIEKANIDAIEKELDELKAAERGDEAVAYREFNAAVETLDYARSIRNALDVRYVQETIEQSIPRTIVEVIEPAKAPSLDDPVRPNKALNIILSIMLGVIAGVGLAYFIEYLDTSVKTIEDIENTMGVSVLGVVAQKVKPLIEERAEHAHAEAYRVLNTNLQSLDKGELKTLCVTSGSVGEGKSLTLFNLAYVCAQLGNKVLIVDSDLHRPRQHKIFGLSNEKGLADVLMGDSTIDDCIVDTKAENLYFMPSGRLPSGAHGLLATKKMGELLADLKKRFDMVFLDSPPIIGVSDASMLVRQVDGVLLVIQHRKYPRALSLRAREMITNIGGNLLGVVLNNINISRDHTYYYYQQHYYYYPRHGRKSEANREEGSRPTSKDVSG